MKPRLLLLSLAAGLVACSSGPQKLPGDDQPTLASLASRSAAKVEPDAPGTRTAVSETQTMAAYQKFLEVAPQAPQRPEALRRLGDLEMDGADRRAADADADAGNAAGEVPDYRAAITRYQDYLKAYPQDPRNDRVLYQLARAQEQGGNLEAALKTLTQLVQQHPGTMFADEAHFRRGELLFAVRDYKGAEDAYTMVLAHDTHTPFHDRALYMQGWSLFKQARLQDALQPFLGVLDLKLGGLDAAARDEPDLARIHVLTRADRELVEDSFRVLSISLSQLQPTAATAAAPTANPEGAGFSSAALASLMASPLRQGYHYRVVMQLADFYLRQERIKDAADTLAAFVRQQPLHPQAPLLQARVVDIYANGGFDTLALQAKKDHVQRYGADSELRRASPSGWAQAQPLVKSHLAQLAQHHHALAQKTKVQADVQEAVRWYRDLLQSFPADADALQSRFLLAELLFEDRQFVQATTEFETVAYSAPGAITPSTFARAADAGYAALLSMAEQEKRAVAPSETTALRRQSVAAALRFADSFVADPRAGAVLTHAAEQLYTLGEGERASSVARQALALQPPPAAEQRRVAWTVVAHQAFEAGAFAAAETAYGEVLALTPLTHATAATSANRNVLVERQAAAIYRQAEAARTAGDTRAAVGHFARVGSLAALPAQSALRATALFDSAAALIALKDWDAAAQALQDFRRQFAGHPLQAEVAPRLALAYLELGRHVQAAAEFEKVAASTSDSAVARAALWQAAELHQQAAADAKPKSALLATAIHAWQRYLQAHAQPVEAAVLARWQLALLNQQDGQAARATSWLRAVQLADQQAGESRTPRTRTLGGQAALRLAEPVLAVYEKVALIEPLQKQLKLKKARLEEVLAAYAAAADVGVAEITTAATFHTAALYQDFGRALLQSQRPKKLSKAEIEQYNVMLEEQAFPFEEKAIELYETNARRTRSGIYDRWVQRSLAALAQLKPVRYGKVERGAAASTTGTTGATGAATARDVAALQSRIDQDPDSPQRAAWLNQLGLAQRQQGHFTLAQTAFEAAITQDPQALDPHWNLAILWDLYLGEPARAQALYQRCLALSPADAPLLNKWLAELKTRKPVPGATPATDSTADTNPATAIAAPPPSGAPSATAATHHKGKT